MKILDRYILTSFLNTFATVFVILFFIFILQGIWLFIADLTGKDLDSFLIVKFLLFYSPKVVPLVLPLSVLLASIMTFGNFAENYEFAAMKSSGISLKRAMKSLTVFILILSLTAFFFANNVIPQAEFKFVNLRKTIIQQKPSMAIAEGQFSTVGSYTIKVEKKYGENKNLLQDVTIHKISNLGVGTTEVIKSKRGELISNENSNFLQLVLYDGNFYQDVTPKNFEERNKVPFAKSSFEKYIINFDLAPLQKSDLPEDQITNTNTMLNVNELKYTLDSLETNKKKDIISFSENLHQRFSVINSDVHNKPKVKDTLISDVTSILENYQKVQLLEIAKSNVANTKYSIEGSQFEFASKTKNINNHWLALYDKFVIAYACILMFFIGAPIGAIIRKGGLGLPIVFAMVIFIVYHFINVFGKKVAQEDGITPFLGAWMSSLLLTPFALLLTYRATNDIGLMLNFDWITAPFQKWFATKEEKVKTQIVDLNSVTLTPDEDWEKLNSLSDESLVQTVKNAKQFDYTETFRLKALKILETRGITQQDLAKSGDLRNEEYEKLTSLYSQFKSQNQITFICYLLAMILSGTMVPILIVFGIVNLIVFYIFLYKIHQTLESMSRISGKPLDISIWITFLVGFPFFIFLYYYNRNQVKAFISQYRK